MIIENGSLLLVVHRRLFQDDEPRFFVGVVEGYEAGLARVSGHSWIRDQFAGHFARKEDVRTKIVSIVSGTLLVYQLPSGLALKELRFDHQADGSLWLVDDQKFRMNLSEKEYRHEPRAGRR